LRIETPDISNMTDGVIRYEIEKNNPVLKFLNLFDFGDKTELIPKEINNKAYISDIPACPIG
jgi:hypothetical protein